MLEGSELEDVVMAVGLGAFHGLSCGFKGKYIKDLELGFGLNMKKL